MADARAEARRLAKRVGATLAYSRKRWHGGGVQVVDITLPEGTCFDCNEGLDELHHECELDEDIWPGVLADLRVLQVLRSGADRLRCHAGCRRRDRALCGVSHMTPEEFRAALGEFRLSQVDFAFKAKASPTTVSRWAKGHQPIPGLVDWLFAVMRENWTNRARLVAFDIRPADLPAIRLRAEDIPAGQC